MRGPVETPFTFSLGRTVRWEKAMPLQNESTRRAVLRSADKRTCSPRVLWNCKIGWDALPSPLFEPRRQEEEKKNINKRVHSIRFPFSPPPIDRRRRQKSYPIRKARAFRPSFRCYMFDFCHRIFSLSLSKRGTFFSMGLSFCVPSPDPPDPAQISYLSSMQVCV